MQNDAGLVDRLHRHLRIVFSLRSFPNGTAAQAENDIAEDGLSTFFLPPIEEGRAYIKCYFDHVGICCLETLPLHHRPLSIHQATSTYRYLDRSSIEDLTERFYSDGESPPGVDDSVLIIILMAIGWVAAIDYFGC